MAFLLLLQSAQRGRFYGDDFVNFRPKLQDILYLE